MSETRELSEQEIDDLDYKTAFEGPAVLDILDVLTLCRMARRGAREAMAARLTDDVLNTARMTQREAFEASNQLGIAARTIGNDAMRRVLLDALTGAGEETP